MIRRALGIALLVPLAYYGWSWWFPSDEAAIRAVLERVAAGMEGRGGDDRESALSAVSRVAALQHEFAPDAVIDAGPPFRALHGWQAIMGAAARVSVAVPGLDIRFPEVSIDVDADRTHANATVVAEAHVSQSGRQSVDARELEIAFARVEGRWVVQSVTLIQPLQRLDTLK